MQFGIWKINDDTIECTGEEDNRFSIPKEELTAISYAKEGQFFYNWILLATKEDWLSQDDLYDLNFAFVYAAAKWGLDFSYEIFDVTLEEQYEQFEEDDEEEWE